LFPFPFPFFNKSSAAGNLLSRPAPRTDLFPTTPTRECRAPLALSRRWHERCRNEDPRLAGFCPWTGAAGRHLAPRRGTAGVAGETARREGLSSGTGLRGRAAAEAAFAAGDRSASPSRRRGASPGEDPAPDA